MSTKGQVIDLEIPTPRTNDVFIVLLNATATVNNRMVWMFRVSQIHLQINVHITFVYL